MPNVYDIALEFRAALLRQDADAAKALVRSYGLAYAKISQSLASLLTRIEAARARKEPVDQAWLLREERYVALLEQIRAEMNRFAKFANKEITTAQQTAIQLSQQAFASQMSLFGVDNFNRLSTNAIEAMVGMAGDGSPLADLLRPLGQSANRQVRDALVNGIAVGQSPRKTAAQIRDALAGDLTRALTIARTETMRAYREASRATYQQNEDVVEGWMWIAKLDTRCCALCWAMHGQVFPLSEPFGTHVNDRCTMAPKTKSIPGVPDLPSIEKGIERFAKLSEAEQEQILGKAKFAAYKAGRFTLSDIVGTAIHLRWGKIRFVKALAEIGK